MTTPVGEDHSTGLGDQPSDTRIPLAIPEEIVLQARLDSQMSPRDPAVRRRGDVTRQGSRHWDPYRRQLTPWRMAFRPIPLDELVTEPKHEGGHVGSKGWRRP